MRTVSATLATLQKATKRWPYIAVTFSKGATSYTYTTAQNRILYIRHLEEPYSHAAVMVLVNNTRDLPNLVGYKCLIDYGNLDAAGGTAYLPTPEGPAPLWVHFQQHISKAGKVYAVLILSGAWERLGGTDEFPGILPTPTYPWYSIDFTGTSHTPYGIIDHILEGFNYDLLPLGIHDDSIVNTITPDVIVNATDYETPAEVIYRCLNMTKCFLRAERPPNPFSISSYNMGLSGGTWHPNKSCFYTLGRYWVIYYVTPGQNNWITSSVDKTTWTAPTQIATGRFLGFALDGNNLHVACVSSTHSDVRYRMATLAADGTVTFPQGVQTAYPQTNPWANVNCNIALDQDGYPTILITKTKFTDLMHHSVVAVSSSTKNGVWTTDVTTTLRDDIHTGTTFDAYCCLRDAGLDTMMAVWDENTSLYGAYRNSTGVWSTPSVIGTTYIAGSPRWDVEGSGSGSAYIAWVDNASKTQWREYDTSDGGGTIDSAEFSLAGPPGLMQIIKIATSGDQYIVWWEESGQHWHFVKRASGSWGDSTVWLWGVDIATASFWFCPHNVSDATYLWLVRLHTNGNMYLDYVDIDTSNAVAKFRLIYPPAWTSYHATYTSDRPDATYHQFKEFEWLE